MCVQTDWRLQVRQADKVGIPTEKGKMIRFFPSNGTEGLGFWENWCSRCQNEDWMHEYLNGDIDTDAKRCEILTNSFFKNEILEWIIVDGSPCCTAFKRREDE